MSNKSINFCLESEGTIEFDWPQHFCRQTYIEASQDPISIHTTQKQRRIEVEAQPTPETVADTGDESNHNIGDSSESSVDANTERPTLPCTLRRRLLKLKARHILNFVDFNSCEPDSNHICISAETKS